eukprot:1142616-Pelagomonas_calceolata.AAC.1
MVQRAVGVKRVWGHWGMPASTAPWRSAPTLVGWGPYQTCKNVNAVLHSAAWKVPQDVTRDVTSQEFTHDVTSKVPQNIAHAMPKVPQDVTHDVTSKVPQGIAHAMPKVLQDVTHDVTSKVPQ